MSYRLTKSFSIEAAHFLPLAPDGHKCRRLHGHSFRIEVHVDGNISDVGWVMDFADVSGAFAPLHDELDHRLLNDVPGLENPTSELLSKWIFGRLALALPGLAYVEVHETCTSGCRYPAR